MAELLVLTFPVNSVMLWWLPLLSSLINLCTETIGYGQCH